MNYNWGQKVMGCQGIGWQLIHLWLVYYPNFTWEICEINTLFLFVVILVQIRHLGFYHFCFNYFVSRVSDVILIYSFIFHIQSSFICDKSIYLISKTLHTHTQRESQLALYLLYNIPFHSIYIYQLQYISIIFKFFDSF